MAGSITSLYAEGSAATPANNATLATLSHSTVLTQPGQYRIQVNATVSAVAAAAGENLVLSVGSTTQKITGPLGIGTWGPWYADVSLDGNTDVLLKYVGGGASVATYDVSMTATYLGRMGQLKR